MSNILKSKYFLGVMIVAAVVVAFAMFATSALAYTHSTTLKMGSTGAQVTALQEALNMTSCKVGSGLATGLFGSLTKAAVMCYQTANGLTADGVVGPMTGSKLSGGSMMGGSYPAGCTSSMGYSTTTGMPCSSGGSYPAGCTSAMGYSPTTGAKCDGSTGGGSPGTLMGGAGSLDDVQEDSSLSEEEVSEGSSNAKVAGWALTADNGSDLAVTAFKLSLEMTSGSGSDNLDDYADKVSIWQGSTKVGSADVDDFSENSGVYSKTVNLTGASIKADGESTFYVSVDALSNIDGSDLGNNTWTVTLESVRVQDATGAILTDSTTGDIGTGVDFSFETVSTASGTELKVSTTNGSSADAINKGHVVDIDDTTNTNDVPLFAFDMKATGDIKNVQDIPVKVVSTGTGQIIDIASSFSLWKDGTQIDTVNDGDIFETSVTESSNTCDNDDTTCWVHFDDVDFDMDDGDTAHFIVKANIRDTSGTLVDGDTLTVTMTSTERAQIDAEDSNGDDLSGGTLTGAASAETIAFYATGIMVVFDSASATVSHIGDPNTSGDSDQGTYVIKFKVTAFGGDMFIDKDPIEDTTPTEVNQDAYKFVDGNSDGGDMDAGVATLTSSGDAVGSQSFRVGEGETETFTLTVVGQASTDTFAYLKLGSIGWNDADNSTAGDTLYTFNLTDFKTGDIYLNDN